MKYGIICWGNSSNSGKIFMLQKKIFGIMAAAQPRTTCISLFKKLEILPVSCQFIPSLMNFIINNQKIFQTNLSVHNINTRNNNRHHRPNTILCCFKKSAFCAGINIFDSLPRNLTVCSSNKAQFKAALKQYINTQPILSADEFFICKVDL